MVNWSDPANYTLIVVIIIFGVGAGVIMAWAVAHRFFNEEEPDRFTISPEQGIYMREVRRRNQEDMAAALGHRNRKPDLSIRL